MSKVNDILSQREALVKTEYTNYEEYMDAQTKLTKRLTSQPARICELCGYPMDYKGHKLSEKEKKWSVHDVCKKKMENMLDRNSGIARERRGTRVNTKPRG